ncbi:MAG TPA: 3-isopropylmalate dehydrogenase [Steroidobacteraceae bacterium]|jgi:3-isopropylmalate dehydrogenase|nr:3-isopropylmalate dehydrogenase [Steroidobacteraceae bacterium]
MKAHVAVLPGDGIGPEVTAQAVRCLEAVAQLFAHDIALTPLPFGGAAIDSHADPLPAATLAACLEADAVLLGAIGGPKWSAPDAPLRPEAGLLRLRKELATFANLRPVQVHPALADASPLKAEVVAGVDLIFVRELTGGIYFGEKQRDAHGARDVCTYTVAEIERIVRVAAALAQSRRGHLTSIDKANVLETSRLWREVTTRVVQREFPTLQLEHMLVDAAAMHLVRRPRDFDVLVTENMFGDILTDEASMLAGSLGLLPSASLGAGRRGIYEPIHGSAPDIAGRGLANPCGALLSVALLLRHSLGWSAEAAAVERAVAEALAAGARTADLVAPGGRALSTAQAGDAVISRLRRAP